MDEGHKNKASEPRIKKARWVPGLTKTNGIAWSHDSESPFERRETVLKERT